MENVVSGTDMNSMVPFTPLTELMPEEQVAHEGCAMVVAAYSPDCPHGVEAVALYERLAWVLAGAVRFFVLNVLRLSGRAFKLGIWQTPAILSLAEGMTQRRARALDEDGVWALLGTCPDASQLRSHAARCKPMNLGLPVRPALLSLTQGGDGFGRARCRIGTSATMNRWTWN